jgi:D-amino-acid oxidase
MPTAGPAPQVIVVGAGVIGLTTACVLGERGLRVEVWSRDEPHELVSAVAGAIWYPFLAEPRQRVLGWIATTFRRLSALAAVPAAGVHLQTVTEVFATATPDLWWASAAGAIEPLPAAQVPPPHRAAIRLVVPVCATPRHLPWLRTMVEQRGGRCVSRELRSLDEALAVCPRVVNCTGLGARELCGDATLQPVRGQVVVVERIAGVDALIEDGPGQPFYVIPRGDELVLGGTAQAGDERLLPDPHDTAAITAGLGARVPALRDVVVRRVKVGLRPCRPTVRLEAETRGSGRVVHNYGHGGSGYTLAWGCAEEAAALLTG